MHNVRYFHPYVLFSYIDVTGTFRADLLQHIYSYNMTIPVDITSYRVTTYAYIAQIFFIYLKNLIINALRDAHIARLTKL